MSARDPLPPVPPVPAPPAGADASAGLALAPDALRAVMRVLACGVVVQDQDGRIIDCNPAAETLLGLSHAQLMGVQSTDPRWRALDGNGRDLPGQDHPAMQTLRTGLPVDGFEMGVCLPSGERRWLLVSSRPLAMAGRTWAVTSFEEATARHDQQRAMVEQWQRLSATLAGSGMATWAWQVQADQMRLDQRCAEIIGRDLHSLTPLDMAGWIDLLHPDDRQAWRDQLQAHRAGQRAGLDIECRVRHQDGGWRWVHDRGRLAAASPHDTSLLVFGAREDITARKQAELDASHAHAMLKGLFELMPVGISLIDMTDGRAVDVNKALCDMLGQGRDDLLGIDLARFTVPELRAARAEMFAHTLVHGQCDNFESAMVHSSGRRLNVLRSSARIVSADGRPHVWSVVQDITARKQLEQQMVAAATQDKLTGLANRATLMQRLATLAQQAQQHGGPGFAVLFLDVDRFKLVNDTLGHSAGDALLRHVADRLQGVIGTPGIGGPDWCAARFGGDEFVLLAPGLNTPQAAQALGQHLQASLGRPYLLQGKEVHCSASIGVALSHGTDTQADALMRDADTAMYEAKRAGRGMVVVFDDTMRARLTRAVLIESALRQAHLRGEMQLAFQPVVDLETGQVSAAEALLRWHHPSLGPVSPREFIPIAEESGDILALGDWVLRQACVQWAGWQQQDPAHAPAVVSVKLLRQQLALGDPLLHSVRQALADAAMPADALQLDIRERELAKANDEQRALLQALHGLGVRLCLDSFGHGASSLGLLRQCPFHLVKLDPSFVTDICNDPHVLAVAHATVQLVDNLGMLSVAGGISQPGELATLQSMGCRLGQGPLFGEPMAADALLAALRARPA